MKSIFDKIEQLLQSETPFVSYRKPMDDKLNLMVQQDSSLYFLENYSQKGFVFAPFDDREEKILFPLEKCEFSSVSIADSEVHEVPNNEMEEELISDKESRKNHIALVKKGIDFLRIEKVRKVVLSRKEEVQFDEVFKSVLFSRLMQSYPLAFVSLCYHPKVGLWMGATPEVLLSAKGKIFKTMALAGTQLFKEKEQGEWGGKEIEEQQIVTDFILEQLKDFDLKVSDPFTKRAGSLLHICTEIKGNLNSNDQLEILINKLHPTSAVCGFPKEKAKLFILNNEEYKRSFYAGFLGELNINKVSDLYVNLRCMQIVGQNASLYIGGGITLDSDPISEWEETVSKSEVMRRVLH